MTDFNNIVGIHGNRGCGKDTAAKVFQDMGYLKISLADPIKRLAKEIFSFSDPQLWGESSNRDAFDPRYTRDTPGSEEMWGLAKSKLLTIGPDWVASISTESSSGAVPAFGSSGMDVSLDYAIRSLIDWFNRLRYGQIPLSPRTCCQTLGTEWGRKNMKEYIWLNLCFSYMKKLADNQELWYTQELGITKHVDGVHPRHQLRGFVIPDVRFINEIKSFSKLNIPIIKINRPSTDASARNSGIPNHQSELEKSDIPDTLFSHIVANTQDLNSFNEVITNLAKKIRSQ